MIGSIKIIDSVARIVKPRASLIKTVPKLSNDILTLNHCLKPNAQQNSLKGIKFLKDFVKSIFKRDPVKKEISDCLFPGFKKFNVERAKTLFKERTGLNLHVTCPDGLESFNPTPLKIIKYLEKGQFPKEIKHVIIGHGTGSTINDTWVISGTNQKVFDYITENIPKGEKALVCCCEETPKNLLPFLPKDKAGIGKVVHTELCTASRPAKIVESGKNEIIGDFAKGRTKTY